MSITTTTTVDPLPGVGASAETTNIEGDDTSQPPPDPPASTVRTHSTHFDDTTDEDTAPAAAGGPEDPDDDDVDWTAIYVMEQNADMPDYVVTEADIRLD